MANTFRCQTFVAFSGNLGWKVPVIDNVLSYNEQEYYANTSHYEKCLEIKFEIDRNFYVDLRQAELPSNLKLVKGPGYET